MNIESCLNIISNGSSELCLHNQNIILLSYAYCKNKQFKAIFFWVGNFKKLVEVQKEIFILKILSHLRAFLQILVKILSQKIAKMLKK